MQKLPGLQDKFTNKTQHITGEDDSTYWGITSMKK